MRIKTILPVIFCLIVLSGFSQNRPSFFKVIPSTDENTPAWAVEMYSADPDVNKVVYDYEQYYRNNPFEKNIHTRNYKFWTRSISDIIGSDGHIDLNLLKKNYEKVKSTGEKRGQSVSRGLWTCIGPFETYNNIEEGGFPVSWQANVYCMDQSAINPDILYTGTEAGGIFKTVNRGISWFPVAQDQPFSTVTDIKIATSNDSIVYATAHDHIFKTINGGESWSEVYYIGETGNQLAINRANPDIVLCASDAGLFRTQDGGLTWTQLFSERCWHVENHPVNPSIVYLTKNNPLINRSEFFKSTDGGLTWAVKTNGWFTPAATTDANDIGSRIAVTVASPDMVYVALIGEGKIGDTGWIGVYRSIDGGESWINPDLPDGSPYDQVNHQNLATYNLDGTGFHQGFFNFGIAVSQSNPAKLWVGCLALSVSADSAKTWTRIGAYNSGSNDIGWIHPDIQDIHAGINEMWISCDGGINYSTDDFQTHESRKTGLAGSDYWGFGQGWNEDVMVGGRYHNGNSGYYQTYGTGNTLRLGGAEAPTGYVNPIEDRKAYFSDISTLILPDAINESVESQGNLGLYPNESYWESYSSELEFHPAYAHHIYIGKDGKIWKSENEGALFEILHNFGVNGRVLEIEISRSNPDVMYCVLQPSGGYWDNCFIYRSSDGGITWDETFQVPANKWRLEISLNPDDENELWVISVNGANGAKVFRTINGGLSWENKTTSALNDHRLQDVLYQAGTDEIIYIASSTGFFYWDKITSEWVEYLSGLPLYTQAMEIKPFYKENKMRLATTGKGIWECDLVSPSLPVAQPMTITDTVYCLRDTVQLDCYSVLNHTGATWSWSFNPLPVYISSLNVRNPKVLFGSEGTYDVGLTITDANGNSSSKTVDNMITVINNCDPDTLPGMALECVNTGDYAITPDLNTKTNNLTITAWVKPEGIQPEYTAIVINNDVSAGFNFRANNTLGYHWPGGAWWWNSGISVPEGEWSHVAMVVYPDSLLVYCNGQSAKHAFSADSVDLGTMSIGSYKGWESRNYKGQIDEVCIWNRSLTKDEIREIRHLTLENHIPVDNSVIAYYQFNEFNGSVLDRKGINHANITGFAFRDLSTAPVGGGTSQQLTINNLGIFDFNETGLSLGFSALGTLPDGNIVVTRIKSEPNILPNSNPNIGCYWIINNYGTNNTFSSLTEVNLIPFTGQASSAIIASPGSAIIFSRSDNSHNNTWNSLCGADTILTGTASIFSYNSNCSISQSGQFFICSDNPLTDIIDNGPITINEEKSNIGFDYVIYPNPLQKGSDINVEYYGSGQLRVKIYSSEGKLIIDSIHEREGNFKINTSGLSSGLYHVIIESGKYIESRKMVIR